tara:strand:+ start:1851 stop:4778 length:2928 start_codon:yes stop_codon:yes gene_type:complete
MQNEAEESGKVLEIIEQNIQETIRDSYSVALTLALTVNQEGEVENFEKIAKKLLENHESVDVLELVPDGVIEYVYPLEGNESVIGYDIINDPKVNAEVIKAAELGTIYFAGPIDLKQGGRAVIGRLPIIIDDEIWGFSAVLIYLETLIEKSGLNQFPTDKYYFQLSKINPDTGKEDFFLPVNDNVKLTYYESVNFPEGDWKLYVTRVGNSESRTSLLIILVLSALGALVIGFLSTKVLKKPEELEALLQEKSEELLKSRERFKLNSELLSSILESPKEIIVFSLDRDFNYLAFNNNHKAIVKSLFNKNLKKGMNVFDFILEEKNKAILLEDYSRALSGEYFEKVFSFEVEQGSLEYWENWFSPIKDKNGHITGITVFSHNITKRIEAEKQTTNEKHLSDTIINSLPGIFYLFNKNGKYLRWNENFEKETGYTTEEVRAAHPLHFVDDDEKEMLTEKIANVFVEGEDAVEANVMRKDGSKVRYYFTGVAINYKGEECLLGVGIDISEQKKAEKELEKVLQQLQNHLNNSPLGVVEYDREFRIINWSKKCGEIFGWKEEEVLGKYALELVYEEDKTKTESVARQLSGGSTSSNISYNRNYTKSGKIIDCIWYNSVVKDSSGKIVTVMSLVEDITEKKKVEEQIKHSEMRYRTLISNAPFCIHEFDREGRLLSINDAGLEIMGIQNREDFIGITYDKLLDPKQSGRILSLFNKALQNVPIDFEFSKNDNQFLSSFIPIKDENGEVNRVMGITQDITERIRSKKIIEESLKEKTTLLSEIHHRVKNNLAIVSGLLELQKNEVIDEKVTTAFEQSINRIISIAMVHELMYKSPDLSSVNVHDYLDTLIPAISATMNDQNKNIEFMIDIADYKLNINEAIPIGLLLNELITNSFKYAFKDIENGVIHIDLSVTGNKINVLYEDNGVGFDDTKDFNIPKNLGLNLIHAQLQQLDAVYVVDTKSRFRLEFSFSPKPTTSKQIG